MTRLILIGFMGSGKTTIGRLLANALRLPHLDLDDLVAADANCSIAQIFTDQGEAYFRDLESQALISVIRKPGILSTGGGTPVREENRQLLIDSDTPVVFLKASPEVIVNRLKGDHNRPLLRQLDTNQFMELYRKREWFYNQAADMTIDTDKKTPEKIMREILAQIREVPV
ncbi:shikimate kinase [Sporolactobacillus sp. CPB3-1]|uniref:Shikimate kinase n=1 Tax=Sporolactobacillus mangiferae TaxID=2940498 RepID=A0ABT0M8T3_9BACL|nr:shikimate kinase [Sporolactobacillus mangiferae]MCL1631293.1 shikimate kinase [Sporolactobacillus mangiferae]